MKYNLQKFAIVSLLFPLLVACNEKFTSDYLMQHPSVLKNELANCQAQQNKTPDQIGYCDTVAKAAAVVSSVLDEQQQNPEQFGQRILDAEIASVKAKEDVRTAELALATLKKNKASQAELQAAEDKLSQAKQTYLDHHNEVKTMLAVIGINSPE